MKPLSIVRFLTALFIMALFISGLTVLPLVVETRQLRDLFPTGSPADQWMEKVYFSLAYTEDHHPFLFYGYDWLAFAHFLFAILYIGAYRDPVKNIWLYDFGLIACFLIIPLALVAGAVRGIPLWWRIIDCSFGVIGALPLYVCKSKIKQIINQKNISYGNSE